MKKVNLNSRKQSGSQLLLGCLFVGLFLVSPKTTFAREPDWSAPVSASARENLFQLSDQELETSIRAGKLHAQVYPVEVTGILPALGPFERFLESDADSFLKKLVKKSFEKITGFHSVNDFLAWMGLHEYPLFEGSGSEAIPFPENSRPSHRMGFGVIDRSGTKGFTFSCAACHSANLFGKPVLGMTNRFPRSNEVFHLAKKMMPWIPTWMYRYQTGASNSEVELFEAMKQSLQSVGVKQPVVLGLDTSLAQVALSLAHRSADAYATKNERLERHPRKDFLENLVADSKPAVWWNLRYKNRWLSDGSVVSGNPIITNILWNEIGRGTDLKVLENWLDGNSKALQDLANGVFASEAPRITDFLPVTGFNLEKMKKGEGVYLRTCSRCHGVYEKAWSAPGAEEKTLAEQMKTIQVYYPENTEVIDVGTDPNRWMGMKSLEQLNELSISKKYGVVIKSQKGYVPPPLVGIWARWPYLHNNSVPSLCALLTRSELRPKNYHAGEALNVETDFDSLCNGYPLGKSTPREWKENSEYYFDTRKKGMTNSGHDEGILLKNGKELLTLEEKIALVQFLQSL